MVSNEAEFKYLPSDVKTGAIPMPIDDSRQLEQYGDVEIQQIKVELNAGAQNQNRFQTEPLDGQLDRNEVAELVHLYRWASVNGGVNTASGGNFEIMEAEFGVNYGTVDVSVGNDNNWTESGTGEGDAFSSAGSRMFDRTFDYVSLGASSNGAWSERDLDFKGVFGTGPIVDEGDNLDVRVNAGDGDFGNEYYIAAAFLVHDIEERRGNLGL